MRSKIKVNGLNRATFGLVWRFLVEDDEDVNYYLVRDADSVINIKERVAVQQWLESGLPFHVMRDYYSHSELVLAGMWGARRGAIGRMGQRVIADAEQRKNRRNDRVYDQTFLRNEVWPLMRGRVCIHDPIFGFMQTHEVPGGYELPHPRHIGQNHAVNKRLVRK